jgi:hypothetical protein
MPVVNAWDTSRPRGARAAVLAATIAAGALVCGRSANAQREGPAQTTSREGELRLDPESGRYEFVVPLAVTARPSLVDGVEPMVIVVERQPDVAPAQRPPIADDPARRPTVEARVEPAEARVSLANARRVCATGERVWFDERELIFRPCVRFVGDAAHNERAGSSRGECLPGQQQFFDRRHSLYRPCLDVELPNVSAERARPTPARGAVARTAEASCAAGAPQYFDTRALIYRPCPPPSERGRGSIAERSPRAERPRRPTTSAVGARCAAGAMQYFDDREGIYRPCP